MRIFKSHYLFPFFLLCSLQLFAQSGKKIELNSIKFDGNTQFSSAQLKLVIYSQETPPWIWKFLSFIPGLGKEPVYFDSTLIKIDEQALSEFYMTNGFFESNVACSYSINAGSGTADIVYKINEGKPSNFGNSNLIGLMSVPNDTYKNIKENFTVDSTNRFSQNVVQENADKIVNNLQNNGYVKASFDSTIVYKDTMKLKADINIYFTPGEVYRISDVFVNMKGEGAPFVQDTLLKQVVDIKPGDRYSLEKIRRSQVRLFRTGMFSSVTVAGVRNDSVKNTLPIEINGTIGQMNEISPEVIVNNQNNAFNMGLGATYTRKNFLGRARKFSASGSFGIQDLYNVNLKNLLNNFSVFDTTYLGYADARITIEQPFLFNEPITGILEMYGTMSKKEISKTEFLNITKYGGKLSFEFEMPQHTYINYLSANYNLEVNTEYRMRFGGNESPGSRTLSVIGADLRALRSDDPVFPTQGNNTALQLEEANLLSYFVSKLSHNDFNSALFYKILASSSYYTPLTKVKNVVGAVKLKVGFIQSYKGNINSIPSDRKFYVGGSNSLRGWTAMNSELNPHITNATNVDTGWGGTFLLEGSTEVRFKYLDNIGTAFFVDWGRSWNDYSNFRFDEIAVSLGVGFRYYTTFAPFRLDIAFKTYDPSAEDKHKWIFNNNFWSNIQFQFGIGEAF